MSRRCENLKGHPGATAVERVGVVDGTLGAAEAGVGAFPRLLGDQALRPDCSISLIGGAAGQAVADGPPKAAPFRLPLPLPGGGQVRDVTGGGASPAAGCWRRHWSRLGLCAPLRSRSLGHCNNRGGAWSLARQRHGVRGDVEAAHGVRGGAAEPRFPEAAALRPSARPHSGPQAPGRRAAAAAAPDADPTARSAAARPSRQRAAPSNSGANFSEHKTRI